MKNDSKTEKELTNALVIKSWQVKEAKRLIALLIAQCEAYSGNELVINEATGETETLANIKDFISQV